MPPDASAEAASAPQQVARYVQPPTGQPRRACAPESAVGPVGPQDLVPILHSTMVRVAPVAQLAASDLKRTQVLDVTRSVASPSDDIKKAAVFEKDALLSAQTMIYDDGEMKKTLPGDVYERFKKALVDGGATS